MRIGFNQILLEGKPNGAESRERNLFPSVVQLLLNKGHHVVVYTNKTVTDQFWIKLLGKYYSEVEFVKTNIPRIPSWKRTFSGVSFWRKQVIKDNLNLIHWPYYPMPKLGIPSILLIHDLRYLYFPDTYSWGRRMFLNYAIPVSLRRATRVHAVSQTTKLDLVKFYNINSNRIDVVYNPYIRRYIKSLKKSTSRECYFLMVGNIELRKNHVRVFSAFKRLIETNSLGPEWKIKVVGPSDSKYSINFQEWSFVEYKGVVSLSELYSYYVNCKGLLFPSLHEGFGYPILEAFDFDVPVLTSNAYGMKEVAWDQAIYVDPLEVESIQSGILKLVGGVQVNQSSVNNILNKYTAERQAKLFYESVKLFL